MRGDCSSRVSFIILLFWGGVLLSAHSQEEVLSQPILSDTVEQKPMHTAHFTDSLSTRQSLSVDLAKINLPPVSVFLEAASNYADIKFYDSKVEEEELLLKQARKDWLSYIRLQANYQYGTNNGILSQSGEDMQGYLYSQNTQSWYNVGVVVSIPLNDLLSRKQKTDIVNARIDQAEYEAERALENRKIIILQAYNEVIKHLSILKVKAEAVALYDAQMQISENDFINGRIDIISLSLERGRRSDAIVKYQESRAALHNAVTLLEMLTKIKIIQ